MKQSDAQHAKHGAGYLRKPNDLITAGECARLVDHRVAVLIAHWEAERRQRTWWRRVLALFRRR